MKTLLHSTNFIDDVIEKLGKAPIDFAAPMRLIREKRKEGTSWLAAGVLLLLHRKEDEYVLQLIKRSSLVPQGGDLSCPGGMLNPRLDRIFAFILRQRLFSILNVKTRKNVQQKNRNTAWYITLFLANALREAWEETGLKPFNARFLGPLPSYDLSVFARTIFPLVAFVPRPWKFRPNWEVDKIVEIPLATFFEAENYGLYAIEDLNNSLRKRHELDFPCLIHQDSDGNEEVLWGATFMIVMSFLSTVFQFLPPSTRPKRIIKKIIHPHYLAGSRL